MPYMTQNYDEILAPYASKPADSRGRLHSEPESLNRSPFQRDRDRIIHSSGFRRLKHKTQVFVYHEGDHYRTRMTHSLEVSQIARSVCRSLNLNEDLAEAVALAHDLGHTPFGHAGEHVLDECMQPFGGFDHNAQALRLVTKLENRYAAFEGLNLTWECLEGLAKHNGPLLYKPLKEAGTTSLAFGVADYVQDHDLELHSYASAEAQVAALADDIAYSGHDLDDGLRANLFDISEVAQIGLVSQILDEVQWTYPGADPSVRIHELVRRLITRLVTDLITETTRRMNDLMPDSAADIRAHGEPVVAFSKDVGKAVADLKALLFERMYRHYLVNRMTSKAKRVVRDLFEIYLSEPECLPTEWQARVGEAGDAQTARVVADFIAGMTDRFAFREHSKLFDLSKVSL